MDRPDAERQRPDLEVERAYPNGRPTYTSTTAVPGERPLSGKPSPSVTGVLTGPAMESVMRLIRANLENACGLDRAATDSADAGLSARLREVADQRREFVEELRALVTEEERKSIATPTQRRRWWFTGRRASRAALEYAEEGEDRLLQEYASARGTGALGPIARLVEDQATLIRHVHDEIRGLRDRCWSHG